MLPTALGILIGVCVAEDPTVSKPGEVFSGTGQEGSIAVGAKDGVRQSRPADPLFAACAVPSPACLSS